MTIISAVIFLLLSTIHQINGLTGTCGVGDKIEPVKSCTGILDCYDGDENAYLADMEIKFTKWCDIDGGICCKANNMPYTCKDKITPRFNEDPCPINGEECVNTKNYTGKCADNRCCSNAGPVPVLNFFWSAAHDFETNMPCVPTKPLSKKYQYAYCKNKKVYYTPGLTSYQDNKPCELNKDCKEGEVCMNLDMIKNYGRHCARDPLDKTATTEEVYTFWIIVAILVIVPIIIIIMCVATCIFCIEMIFCVVIIGVIFFFLGVAGVLGAFFHSG